MTRNPLGYSAPRDANRIPVIMGVSSVDGFSPVPLEVNPVTGRLLAESAAAVISSNTSTLPTATVTTTSSVILAVNASRLGVTIYNEGPSTAYVALSGTASLTAYTIQIALGGYYELPFSFRNNLSAITASSTAVLRVTELT